MQRPSVVYSHAPLVIRGARVLVVLIAQVEVLAGALGCWLYGSDPS
jgi:hypothetical protein